MIRILQGDCRSVLPTLADGSVQCCVTSPPYFGLRDYGVAGQIGLELTPEAFIAEMVAVFREVRRVLRDDGVLWLNLGDSYNGGGLGGGSGSNTTLRGTHNRERQGEGRKPLKVSALKPKDLIGIPWMAAFALRADGWYLRSDCIWHKPNPMPESCTDRPTSAHEHVFLLTKNARYFYNADAVREDVSDKTAWTYAQPDKAARAGITTNGTGKSTMRVKPEDDKRNLRNVWTIATSPTPFAHFATMPPELAERCIKAGSKSGDTVLDPFSGAGTTAMAADRLQRHAIGIELNPAYADIAKDRLTQDAGLFAELSA